MKCALFVMLLAGFALVAVAPVFGQNGSPLPRLKVQGNRFVDEAGNTVVLRGMSFADPDKLEAEGHWNRAYFQAAKD